jgi:hypothetical protein
MAQTLPAFDFTKAQDVKEWQPTHDVSRLDGTPEGMRIAISGSDPYLRGPARDYPAGTPLWLRIRLKSDRSGMGQVFYFTAQKGANEADSVRFAVPGGRWVDARVPMPPLGPGTFLRLDPPGDGGSVLVASITFAPRLLLKEPAWPKPEPPALQAVTLSIQSGDVQFEHTDLLWTQLGGFVLRVDGRQMAVGWNRPRIGYTRNGQVRWFDLAQDGKAKAAKERNAIIVQATIKDQDGGDWELRQKFAPGREAGTVDVETRVLVSQERNVVFLPMLALLPGVGNSRFGEGKRQALFAGLEYLDRDEPSSSEKDIEGPGAQRQVPDTLRITFPLMVVQAEDRYIGLIWDKDPKFSALFDSPDRTFHSGGHLMGVVFPGSDGQNRVEGSLLPYEGARLAANAPLILHATIIGGKGTSVVPAVQQYVALRGLPPVPKFGDAQAYLALAASGWLDSKIRVGDRFRHAWPGGFEPQAAADAAVMMRWLALQTTDTALAKRLREAAEKAVAQVPPEALNASGVSHVRPPVAALVYGHVAENAAQALEEGRGLLSRFEPDGSVLYRRSPGGLDYGRTHFAPDANGLTAQVVVSLLQDAVFSGDPDLIREGLRVLRALDKFADTAPRGAQTWEVPLHTPDILASAHLVRAYTLGYELTGDAHFLEQARYWAWTGVPFVYLVNPTSEPIGLYATTAVYGATQWVAPDWMGLPVQWCGLVYADALYYLLLHDPAGPWKRLADGITASGIQQTWPTHLNADRVGLLPDSFSLRAQVRNDAAINPGTLLANAVRLLDKPALYAFRAFRTNGLLIHAPGAIQGAQERAGSVSFTVRGWPDGAYDVLIVGFKSVPRVRINGKDAPLSAPHRFQQKEGRLILRVEGRPALEIATQ